MTDVSNTPFAAAMINLRRSVEQVPGSRRWRWLLFDSDLETKKSFQSYCAGPVVSFGLPWLSAACSLRWLGPRFFFWPAGIPRRLRISIVSSRLKQRLDEESWWFDLLRTAVLRIDPSSDVLCAATGTAAERFVVRSAELFGRSLLQFCVDAAATQVSEDELSQWLCDAANTTADSSMVVTPHADADFLAEPPLQESYAPGVIWPVHVSAPIVWPANSTAVEPAHSEPTHGDLAHGDLAHPDLVDCEAIWQHPIADRILMAAGDRLQVLQARNGGAIQALLTHHVQDSDRQHALVLMASDAKGQPSTIWLPQSTCVIPWLVDARPEAVGVSSQLPEADAIESRANQESASPMDMVDSTPLSHPEDWLLHWTRAAIGPWPDQQEQEFDDELILGCRSSDRSALATLLRIVNERRLWASSETIRGGHRVVSFTEVPLQEFPRRRTYRRHRRRYDFEPWGIAIRRKSLIAIGARPVVYGDEELWSSMPDEQRPFFQNANAGDGWTREEREWRVPDHVALDEFPDTDVAVFVETAEARDIVSQQTRWLVLVVPSG